LLVSAADALIHADFPKPAGKIVLLASGRGAA